MNLLVSLALIAGCPPETGVGSLVPEIAVAPGSLDFGDQAVPLPATLELTIANAGRATLIADLSVQGDPAFSLDVGSLELPPGQARAIPVTFTPDTFLDFAATVVIDSNDVETPTITVPLTGTGADLPVPDLRVTPAALDFGDVPSGDDAIGILTLANAGDAPLSLGTLSQSGSGAFTLLTDPSDGTIAPRSDVPVVIAYAPSGTDGDAGVLQIPSDDPDDPLVEVPLLGNGGGDFPWPEAAIDCPGTAEPPEVVPLSGEGSVDPEGHTPLGYAWTLTRRPPGSRAELTNLVTPTTRFFADVAGTYEVQLVVENTLGVRSAPDRCTIDAIPPDALHVELTWDRGRADLDLHLLQDGADLFDVPGDCTWCNPTPAWGGPGSADDPRLDLDDRGGYGPENINIEAPADGAYDVKVHYFAEHGDDAVTATVRIYTYGVLEAERSRILSRNEVWDVARVNWPAGTVGLPATPPQPAPVRSCR